MPITTSYPGVYVEELPSVSHSVTAAPTSVTVFIGYTHPFKTRQFKDNPSITATTAVEISNFADYQDNFGGFFSFEPWLPDYVGNAVFQFFQNGGSDAWVIGLKAGNYLDADGKPIAVTGPDGNPVKDNGGNGTYKTLGGASTQIKMTGEAPAAADTPAPEGEGEAPAQGTAEATTTDVTVTFTEQELRSTTLRQQCP